MATRVEEQGPLSTLEGREDVDISLGELDITTESLAGIEQELEAFKDSEVLRAILDEGKWALERPFNCRQRAEQPKGGQAVAHRQ